ncbi:signal peptidase II [Dictyobacter arantiisoli]|uniref:Lipoprotein signal peptidase n=1 Tax=Dictyobacter arantiisoli TaxID=2014874 RepID=A0A5A5TII4_9CHLR|nr:signal peptidase II [Dictyobacter arantiisoli]GCF10809.1 hypothetical protein KDI_43730 [Dictyobacter arantiisoli]
MPLKRARLYDVLALCLAIIAIACDQWTKSQIVHTMTVGSETPFPIFGQYLVLNYIRNSGAAFSMLSGGTGSIVLAVLISLAIIVICAIYARMWNTGSLVYKLTFGLILGGAFGNLIDRVVHSGYVVDFVSFRIPEINYYFAVFNVADACISVGVILLFLMVLFGGLRQQHVEKEQVETNDEQHASHTTSTLDTNKATTTEYHG